jgi:hypothetical protein
MAEQGVDSSLPLAQMRRAVALQLSGVCEVQPPGGGAQSALGGDPAQPSPNWLQSTRNSCPPAQAIRVFPSQLEESLVLLQLGPGGRHPADDEVPDEDMTQVAPVK